jgi:peptide/nickel transport system substrate-binding protein
LFSYGGRAIRVLVTVAIALTFLFSGLSIMNPEMNVEAQSETVLRMGFLTPIDSLNPYVGMNDVSYVFYGLVYDALTCIGNDLETVPNLAKEWWTVPTTDPEMQITGAPYGSVWQYNLTTNALWTDGEPFTADDVVWNIQLNAKNYEVMWAYQPYSYFMKDAVKVDESTVRVYFYERLNGTLMPASYAYLMSIPMLPRHMLQSMNAFDIGFNWTGVFEGTDMPIVSTGPFMASPDIRDEWLASDHVTLLKNPNCHWGPDYAKYVQFDEIVMYFYDDSTAMSYALQNNQIDVVSFPPQTYRAIENGIQSGSITNVTTFGGPKITQYWTEIGVNMNNAGPNPSRLDRTIREAMAMATNKSYIVQNYYLGMAGEGSTLIPPINQFWHYEPNATEEFQFNIAAASALLENAGYRDVNGDGIRECTADSYAVRENLVIENTPLQYQMLLRREYPEERDIAIYLESQWHQIGIDINYLVVDESTLSTMVYGYGYDTMIWYWSADIDPNYQLFVQSKAAWNAWSDNKYGNDSYEENYTKSVNTLDRDLRKLYVDNCQRIHYLDAAYIILAYPNQTYAWRTDTFAGWGDWAANPGRSIDAYWTGNPLYFDLVPIVEPIPEMPGLLLPVLAVGLIVVVAARRLRR